MRLDEAHFTIFDVETTEMQQLAQLHKKEYETILTHKYSQDIPIKIINLMLEDERYENLERFLDLIERLKAVQEGKVDINDAHKAFSESLNDKYVYSKFGGKDKFEKEMSKK